MDTPAKTRIPYELDPKKCGYHGGITASKKPCGKWAGAGTDHVGTGKCKRCCRFGAGRPIVHGRYSTKNKGLRERADEIAASADPLNFVREISFLKACMETLEVKADEAKATNNYAEFERLLAPVASLSAELSKMSERMERIRNGRALTAVEVQVHLVMMRRFVETLPEAERPRFREFVEGSYPALPGSNSA